MKKQITSVILILFALVFLFMYSPSQSYDAGILSVHFLDVGQADCEIILLPTGETIVIDGGNNNDHKFICNYLDSLNIDTIDCLIGTHPHEDHIGSVDTIINNYCVKNFYLPPAEANTKTYCDVLTAAENNNIPIKRIMADEIIYSNGDINIQTVAPVKTYDDLNNQSIVVRLTYKKSSFLFTGDAESLSENDILADVSADVLKVGHHGSRTSSSGKFLDRVDPMYAVISCGKNNEYGHPHYETLERLYDRDITVYRTDRDGTLICTTRGQGAVDYKWECVD